MKLVPALAGQSWTPLYRLMLSCLTAVKRKIYLEVLVEDPPYTNGKVD